MWTKTEDVYVMKLVDFIARIPEHLDLHFPYFSTNFYKFLKFTRFLFLSSCNIFSLDPRNILISYTYAPGPVYSHGIRAIPARSIADGEEELGERITARLRTLGWSGLGWKWSKEVAPQRSRGGGGVRPSPASSDELRPAWLG